MGQILDLLKEFDIAKILPEISQFEQQLAGWLRFFLLLGPLVMAGMGAWYYYAPAKEPNYGLGYRTKWSMASPAAWRYAQRVSGMIYMILGGVLAVIVLVLSLFFGLMSPVTVAVISLIAVFLEALLALGAFILVENLLRKHFDANGDRI